MEPGEDLFAYGVCVKSCPTAEDLTVECNPACGNYPVYPTYYLLEYCAFGYDDLPAEAQEHWDDLESSFSNTSYGSAAMDVYSARWVLALSPVFAVIFTFGYIYFMDKCAYWLSWISVGIIQLALIGTGLGCYFYRKNLIEGMTDE